MAWSSVTVDVSQEMGPYKKAKARLQAGETCCVYCHKPFLESFSSFLTITIEHLVPRGGKYSGAKIAENEFICCYKCNTVRRDQFPWKRLLANAKKGGRRGLRYFTDHKKKYYVTCPVHRERLLVLIKKRYIDSPGLSRKEDYAFFTALVTEDYQI